MKDDQQGHSMATPLSDRGYSAWTVYLLAITGFIYLLNPGAGVFELIPDNIPFIGNLDEGVAAILVWYGLLEFFHRKKSKNEEKE
jgi:hypothetical protein